MLLNPALSGAIHDHTSSNLRWRVTYTASLRRCPKRLALVVFTDHAAVFGKHMVIMHGQVG